MTIPAPIKIWTAEEIAAKNAALAVTDEAVDVKAAIKAEDAIGSMEFMRKAINAPSVAEVKDMIQNEIMEYNLLNKIELKTDKGTRTLKDEMRHYLFPEILTAVDANIPVALIGPAGSGKSTVTRQIADALELKFYLQNSVSGDHQLAGYLDAYGKYNTTSFREAFEKGGLILIDEVDTSDAGALKWINTALANGYAMFPDQPDPINKHADFRVMIAANTFGNGSDRVYVGANQLDASTLDRFVFFDYRYDEKMERIMSGNLAWAERVQELRKAAMKERARIVISPRATINGAKLLTQGWSQTTVEERVIWKGLDGDLKDRIIKAANDNVPKSKGFGIKKKAA